MVLSDHSGSHSRLVQRETSNFAALAFGALTPRAGGESNFAGVTKTLAAIVVPIIRIVTCIGLILAWGRFLLLVENMQDRAIFVFIDYLKPATVHGFGGKL